MPSAWGLRGRWFRRVIAAWIIVLSTTAAIADDSCCCCDCRGWLSGVAYPELDEIDPMAQARIRESEAVRRAVGEITSIEMDGAQFGLPNVQTHILTGESNAIYEIVYYVVGATLATTITVFVVERENGWVLEAIQSADGTVLEGTVPEFEVYTGGGGDWD